MDSKRFKPAWWLPNSHLQTIWPVLCRRSIKNLKIERERFELPDGDFLDIDWVRNQGHGPLVLILHGLEGSIESHYAKGMLQTISKHGWRGAFMHFRGCSGEPNRLPRGYHSGDTNDVQFVVQQILKREPNLSIAAVGFSLGGNVLLKWLGETNGNNPLKAAIAISVPFELQKAASHICKGFSKFYQWYFIRCLRESIARKLSRTQLPLDSSVLSTISTMYDFDDKITAPLHGFASVEEYYSVASSRQYLRDINVPTLIIQAKDDPFMPEDVIPTPSEISPQVELEITEMGGHVGFVTGKYPWRPKYWLEERVPGFLADYICSEVPVEHELVTE